MSHLVTLDTYDSDLHPVKVACDCPIDRDHFGDEPDPDDVDDEWPIEGWAFYLGEGATP